MSYFAPSIRLALSIVSALLLGLGASAEAQEANKIPRIGFFPSGGDSNERGTQTKAFRQELRDLGYVEGKSVLVEYRYVGAEPDRVPSIVAEFLKLQVDVLVVGEDPQPAVTAVHLVEPILEARRDQHGLGFGSSGGHEADLDPLVQGRGDPPEHREGMAP